MTNEVIPTVYMKTHKWHLKMLILELHLNPWFKWNSTKQNASSTSSNNIITSCHIHASYCCICLCLIVGTVLLDRSSSGDRSRVPVRGAVLCTLFYQASKPPCSFRYNPSLAPAPCYCIRTTTTSTATLCCGS